MPRTKEKKIYIFFFNYYNFMSFVRVKIRFFYTLFSPICCGKKICFLYLVKKKLDKNYY